MDNLQNCAYLYMGLQTVMTGEKRYLDRFAEASKRSASILAHDYGAEITKQEEEHLSTFAHTLTGEWNPGILCRNACQESLRNVSCLPHCWFSFGKVIV